MKELKVSTILLAAGLSRRMGCDKLLLMYEGRALLHHAIDLLTKLPVHERIIISSETRLDTTDLPVNVKAYINPTPEEGQSSSIKLGVNAATGTHYLFLAADQPRLTIADLLPLLETVKTKPDKIIYPMIDSKPCSPTLFPKLYKKQLINITGDTGGRIIRDTHPEHCFTIKPKNPLNFKDIDTLEDLTGGLLNDK